MKINRSARSAVAVLALVTALAGCRDATQKQARLQDALPFLPMPPNPVFVSRTGSEDALQVVLTSEYPMDSIIQLYRRELSHAPWTLSGDQPAADGGRTLLATRGGHPLWVMIVPDPDGGGTRVSLNGAVVAKPADSTGRMGAAAARTDTAKSRPVTPAPRSAPPRKATKPAN